MTPEEVKVWNWLRESVAPLGYHFRRQVPIDRFVVDFACLKSCLIVEIDGEQHGRDLREADADRDLVISKLGYRVLRFTNRDVNRHKDAVLDTIFAAIQKRGDDPSPLGEGRANAERSAGVGVSTQTTPGCQPPTPPPGSAFGRVRPPPGGRDQRVALDGAE